MLMAHDNSFTSKIAHAMIIDDDAKQGIRKRLHVLVNPGKRDD